jgi:hypothetical protein
MLDDFAPEVPVVRIDKKPPELEGFLSEVPPPAASRATRVSTRASWDWRRATSPTVLLSTGSVCAALALGAMATPGRSLTSSPPQLPEVQQHRVFVATTLVVFPAAVPKRQITLRSSGRQPARKTVLRAKDLTPAATPVVIPRATQSAPRQDIPQARPQPTPSPQPIATTGIVVPSAPPPGAVATAGIIRTEEAVVRDLLDRYRGAYEQLDAKAARRIWPGVDERRLARAFSDLVSQTLDFEECRIDIDSARGVAKCRGRATYVVRIGKRTPQTQDRSWTFQLHKSGDRWAIDSVRAQ